MERSVQPCKVAPNLAPSVCRVAYGGVEIEHWGRIDVLPTNNQIMEWVNTGYGRIPDGGRPVEGGYEETGEKLYHGVALVQNEPVLWVLGKCGEHLVSAGKLGFVQHTHTDGFRTRVDVTFHSVARRWSSRNRTQFCEWLFDDQRSLALTPASS